MSGSGRRLLLSGAQGLLGRSVARHWLESTPDAEVVGFGRSPRLADRYPHDLELGGRSVPAGLPPDLRHVDGVARYSYLQCRLDDPAALVDLVAATAPDLVIHSAAALRDDAVTALVRSNVAGTVALIEACLAFGSVRRFVLVSSGSVVGRPTVEHPLAAVLDGLVDPYAITKRAAEQLAAAQALRAGLPLTVARVFNLIGPGLQPRHLPAEVAGRLEAIRRGAAPPRLDLGDLSTRRDLIAVHDAARALVAIADGPEPGSGPWGGLVDVGSGTATLMRDLVGLLVQAAGLRGDVGIYEAAGRPFDAPTAVADMSSLRRLGASPVTPLTDSCTELLAYVRHQWDATG